MKKVGILCAGDTEFFPFLQYLKDVTVTTKAMLQFHEGLIKDIPVVALYSGVCKVNAAIAAQLLIDIFHADIIINAGTAGAIDGSVRLFDTIIADKMAYHDVADDILTEFHPWMESVYFKPPAELLALAQNYSHASEHRILFGTVVTGEQFINNSERAALFEKYAPLSVDMETASIAHVCHVNQIPFLSIRTITDTAAHDGIENFEKNCEQASQISAEITVALLQKLEP